LPAELASLKEPGLMVHICYPSSQETKAEDYEFKTSLGYIANSRLA
jgi:hypothetical protein